MNTNQTLRQATLAKWSTIFQEQQSSGLTIKEWCLQNDVSIHSFYYWKRAAKEEYLKSVMPEIVPISSPSDPLPVAPAPKASAPTEGLELYNFNNSSNSTSDPIPISISMGDIRIEIGASAPDALITKIIGALRNA